MTGPALELRHAWKSYGRVSALENVSFSIGKGEVFALLGVNGAGKTTAIKSLLGFSRLDLGSASIRGSDSWNLAPEARRRIGFMAEGNRLDPLLTGEAHLRFVEKINPNWNRSGIGSLLSRFNLPLTRRVGTFSNGQRGQLAILIALGADPDILVLDDPMLGLDAIVRRHFFTTLAEILAQRDRSVLFTSHILSDVENIADRIAIMSAGRIRIEGTLTDLQKRVRRFHGAPPADDARLLSRSGLGNAEEVITLDWQPEGMQQGGTLSLEEIFIALLGTEQTR